MMAGRNAQLARDIDREIRTVVRSMGMDPGDIADVGRALRVASPDRSSRQLPYRLVGLLALRAKVMMRAALETAAPDGTPARLR